MRHGAKVRFSLFNLFLGICFLFFLLHSLSSPFLALAEDERKAIQPELDELEKRIASFVPSPITETIPLSWWPSARLLQP